MAEDDYPPEVQVGHGAFRISWWDAQRQHLAGVELWPDNPAYPDARLYLVPIRLKRPVLARHKAEDDLLVPRSERSVVGNARHAFRRRCGWCGVVLRGWQLNLCRTCRGAAGSSPLPGQGLGSSPFPVGSRWDAEPDEAFPKKPKHRVPDPVIDPVVQEVVKDDSAPTG